MEPRSILLYVFDGFADWEPAHAVAELRREGGFRVEVVAARAEPVVSMGGLRVLPSSTVEEVAPATVAAVILPGGDRWGQPPDEPALRALLGELDARNVPIAAICGATLAVARWGLIRGRRHTSNSLEFLRTEVATYDESANYVDEPAVRDRHLITASGLADVEFARELFEELGVMTPGDRVLWTQAFRSGRLPVQQAG
jgi:putative intracellular protease/amidase